MRRLLVWLGGIFLALIVVLTVLIGYFAYEGSSLDASSKVYVDESVKSIVSTWSKEELLKRASPQLRQLIKEDELSRLFAKLAQLGRLQTYEGSKGDANISLTARAGKVITASYVATAKFDNGPAQVHKTVPDTIYTISSGIHGGGLPILGEQPGGGKEGVGTPYPRVPDLLRPLGSPAFVAQYSSCRRGRPKR